MQNYNGFVIRVIEDSDLNRFSYSISIPGQDIPLWISRLTYPTAKRALINGRKEVSGLDVEDFQN